jgi:hypothetical protein
MEQTMSREIIRVEPLSTWPEGWKAPNSAVTRHDDTIEVCSRQTRTSKTDFLSIT